MRSVYLFKEGLQQNNSCSAPEIVLYWILDLAIEHRMWVFFRYGPVTSVRTLPEKFCAFVNFKTKEAAGKAMQSLQVRVRAGVQTSPCCEWCLVISMMFRSTEKCHYTYWEKFGYLIFLSFLCLISQSFIIMMQIGVALDWRHVYNYFYLCWLGSRVWGSEITDQVPRQPNRK